MNRSGRNEQFLTRLRVRDNALNLKLHLAFEYRHDLVRLMGEVFPAPSRRIDPQDATEPARRPAGGHVRSIDLGHARI